MSNTLPWEQPVYRNRHGRGQRRPMFGTQIPAWKTANGHFERILVRQLRRFQRIIPAIINNIDFGIEEIPPSDTYAWEEEQYPLSQGFAKQHSMQPRIVLYRKPIETLACNDYEYITELVQHELIKRISQLTGIEQTILDPYWEDDES